MDDQALLEELLGVARKLGVPGRVAPFGTPAAAAGGRRRPRGRELVLLDARASLPDRVGGWPWAA
jgi:hypothetical protein